MTFGLIFTSYRTAEYLTAAITPWVNARKAGVAGYSIKIAAVSCPFIGFDLPPEDGTTDRLRELRDNGSLDFLITSEEPVTEVHARGQALQELVAAGADVLIQWDGDEVITVEEIERLLKFVKSRPLVTWMRLPYRNLVFTRNQYLAEPFTPPRIHRVKSGAYRAAGFWDDNNVEYHGTITRDIKKDITFPCLTVPAAIANPLHYTWLNDSRSKLKEKYQRLRWGECSFSWDDRKGGLIFNEDYYRKRGLPLPEVRRISE